MKKTFEVRIPTLEGDGVAEIVPIEVETYIDEATGDEILTLESREKIEKTLARRQGLLLPDEIRGLRERLDLSQEELSELLQIGAKTYTRWETGRARPSRSLNVLLRALSDGAVSVDYLRNLRDGIDWTPLAERRLNGSYVPSLAEGRSAFDARSQSNRRALFDDAATDWSKTFHSSGSAFSFSEGVIVYYCGKVGSRKVDPCELIVG